MAEHIPYRPHRGDPRIDDQRGRDQYAPSRAPGGGAAQPANDPLAELARLIGQEDPFADRRGAGAPQGRPQTDEQAAAEWLARQRHADQNWNGSLAPVSHPGSPKNVPAPGHQAVDQRAMALSLQHAGEPYEAEPNGPAPHVSGRMQRKHDDVDEVMPRGPMPHDPMSRETVPHSQEPMHDRMGSAAEYGEHAYSNEDDDLEDEYYDEEPRESRRVGLMAVAAVLGIAVVGSAGFFGYRMLTGSSGQSGQPPVIKAETTPNKVVPATQGEGQQSKMIYDRVGDRSQSLGEKVVSREEQPVEIRDTTRPASRASGTLPGFNPGQTAVALPPPSVSSGANPSQSPAPAASIGGEPRKVRTVTIKPDQTSSIDPATRSAATAGVNTAPVVVGSAAPVRVQTQRVPGTTPLAISPQGQGRVEEQAPAARPAAPPLRTASAHPSQPLAANVESGGYVVQVSAQKTEEEATTSFRSIQAKYPNVLGGRQPLIRRADLGEKGVFYRAQVGPFATQELATQFCGNLKAAGGQCLVQRN